MEPFKDRLKRFIDNEPIEFIWNMLASIGNEFLKKEIEDAKKNESTHLIILGCHAIIEIISEKIYRKKGKSGVKFFLEEFIDEELEDRKFSLISDDIDSLRNVIAHVWFSKQGHSICAKYDMPQGWKKENGILYINPNIYVELFIKAFSEAEGKIYYYFKNLHEQELIVNKYKFICDYLNLSKYDLIVKEIENLEKMYNEKISQQDFDKQEILIKKLIYERYELT